MQCVRTSVVKEIRLFRLGSLCLYSHRAYNTVELSLLDGEEIEGQVEVVAHDVVVFLEGGQEKHEGI